VIGESFEASNLKQLLPEPDLPYLDERLPKLIWKYYLLIRISDLIGNRSSYAFLHSLIYKTFQKFMMCKLEPLYVDLHKKVALQLEAEHRDKTDRTFMLKIAKHFEDGRVPQKALEYLRQAAATARRDSTYYDLVSIDERIIRLIEQNEEGSLMDLQETYIDLGKSYEILGRKNMAVKVLNRAVHLAVELQDDLRKAHAQTYLGISLFLSGKFDESEQVINEALDIYRSREYKLEGVDLTTYGIALDWAGINHRNRWDMDEAIRLHQQAIHIAQRSGDKRLEAHATANIGAVYMWQKDLESVVPEWERALQLTEEIADQPWIAHYTIDLGLVLFLKGKQDYEKALEKLNKGLEVAKEGYFEDNLARGLMNKANVYFVKGCLKEAEKLYLDALEVSQETNVARLVWRIEHNLGNVYLKRRDAGDINRAEKYYVSAVRKLEDMLKDFKSNKDKLGFIRHRLNPFRSLIKMYVECNRDDLAIEYAHRGIDKSLLEYYERRRQEIQLAREEQEKSNFNFIDGFYVETE
jgi:tetratricopeptide (TPR) repeat protein